MKASVPTLKVLAVSLLLAGLSACASTDRWSASGGSREAGVVRLSYEYPEFHQPQMSNAEAEKLALNRCNSWGYQQAEPIEGQVRQCSNKDDGNCNLWTVTREFQCKQSKDSTFASRLTR